MNLKQLTNDELLRDTERAARDEREASVRLLHHLNEVERRRLFARVGCDSLFSYCVRVLKMSEPQAGRRVNSARLLRECPEVEEKLQEGALTLSAVSQAQVFFRRERVSPAAKGEILRELEGKSSRAVEKILISHSSNPAAPRKESVRALSDDLSEVRLTLDKETMENLERLREIWSHKMPGANLAEVVKEMAALCREKLDPEAKAGARRSTTAPELARTRTNVNPEAPRSTTAPESRYIPAEVKRAVYMRDKAQCTYEDSHSGRRCGSRYHLQIDHIKPFSLGGKSTPENLRLRCRAHNQWHAIKAFGPAAALKFVAS